jgi:hypothetical protein
MDTTIQTALITSGFGTLVGIIWKVINHYRVKSSCNKDNELVISVVDTNTDKNVKPNDIALEIKEEINHHK